MQVITKAQQRVGVFNEDCFKILKYCSQNVYNLHSSYTRI